MTNSPCQNLSVDHTARGRRPFDEAYRSIVGFNITESGKGGKADCHDRLSQPTSSLTDGFPVIGTVNRLMV